MGIDQSKDTPFSPFQVRRANENAYVVFVVGEVAADNGTLNLHLKNPTSGRTIDVDEFIIGAQFAATFNIYDSFSSAPSGGSTEEIDNILMDAEGGTPDSGNMEANSGVTFTEDGAHFGMALPGGGAGGNATAGAINSTTPLIESGREVVLELTNTGSNPNDGGIAIVYTEKQTAANLSIA